MEGPPLGPGGEDINWPDQVAPQGQKASSTRKIKPQTSNLKPLKNGDKGGKGGGKGVGKGGNANPATTPPAAEGDPKKRPQGDNASHGGNNSKKRRLAWMAKSLMAAGVDVKFPAEE